MNSKSVKKKVREFRFFRVIKAGFKEKGVPLYGCGSCGTDDDWICHPLCPTASCRHDGCCGPNTDWGGEPQEML